MTNISFIHAADLHLDSPFKGLSHLPEPIFQEIKESTFKALDLLVERAIDKHVDFVLLVGDLFDNEEQSLKAQVRLRNAFAQLDEHDINVYLSYGNHDFTRGNSHPVTYPDNVFIFPDEHVTHFTFRKDGKERAAIYGFSYENRSVTAKKAEEYEAISEAIPFHIAMLHGSIYSSTDHDVYAPFHLSDLIGKNFDYWALGHIHRREVLKDNPLIVYPGNIQGRTSNETGSKGCYHVELSAQGASLTFLPLQSLEFNHIKADLSECDELHQLESAILRKVSDRCVTGPELLELTLSGHQSKLDDWEASFDEVIQLVNESLMHHKDWKYIYRYAIKQILPANYNELAEGEHFAGELLRHAETVSTQPYLTELFQHKQAKKYLETLSLDKDDRIKQKAKRFLIHELLRGGE
ncbi:DNA repair exonuclease [Lentibacillus kapialis]|uniref:DNA repair exonuclease n=1 Tax=Lentibacillus kapialis TaxID=340214 RepID=A0A917PUZ8_9BACI|nr:DNA repair exonuclease [Lentibacillus kapialis]GGJ92330.1 DNA repair exonuclease [Lentibacillus kapialis]